MIMVSPNHSNATRASERSNGRKMRQLLCLVPLRSESAFVNPALHFISNCKKLPWHGGEPTVQFIRIPFQWDGLIGAAAQEASHIHGSKLRQSQLFVLDDVDK